MIFIAVSRNAALNLGSHVFSDAKTFAEAVSMMVWLLAAAYMMISISFELLKA